MKHLDHTGLDGDADNARPARASGNWDVSSLSLSGLLQRWLLIFGPVKDVAQEAD